MRVGRIPYINCYPVYGAIDRGLVPLDAELVDGVPTALNQRDGRRARSTSASSRPSSTRATRRSICCCPISRSAATARCAASMLFSKRPASELARPARAREPQLDDERRAARAAVRERLGREADVRAGDAELADIARFGEEEHDARLVIGDAALHLWSRCAPERTATSAHAYRYAYDLGAEWKDVDRAAVRVRRVGRAAHRAGRATRSRVHARLIASRDWGLAASRRARRAGRVATGVAQAGVPRVSVGARLRLVVPSTSPG